MSNLPDRYIYLKCSIVSDQYKNIGPLGGLHAGLKASDSKLNLVTACDMPKIEPALIKHLTSYYGYDAVVPKVRGFPEPLLALYSKTCLAAVEIMITEKDYRISHLYPKVKTKYISESELKKHDPLLLSFNNINTLKALKEHERKD